MHDSWGPETEVVVHAYEPDVQDGGPEEAVWGFATGTEAARRFLELSR